MKERRPWLGSVRMWIEALTALVAVALVYWALGLHDTPPNRESPETDGEALDEIFQVYGAVVTFLAVVVLAAMFEVTRLVVRARRRTSAERFSRQSGRPHG